VGEKRGKGPEKRASRGKIKVVFVGQNTEESREENKLSTKKAIKRCRTGLATGRS